MCGIAGILRLGRAEAVDPGTIRDMVSVLSHRGPDGWGMYVDERVGLGHSRLSIIDLAGGAQPIPNEDETLWIVYNGEIFNYVELREELAARGHRFRTATDTEVILHLFEERGPSCLAALNGQFAFAIWNSRKGELFLARDRMGIRPLHYTLQGRSLLFASEIKSLFTVPEVPRRIDPVAMDQVFTFWTTLPGRTAFQGILELPPGCYLQATGNGSDVRVQRFWEIPFLPPSGQLSDPPERLGETALSLLADATRIRLRADVPVGCYVSGGLDSSGVAALANGFLNGSLRTFGIRFEDPLFDEGEHQSRTVGFLRTSHTEVRAGDREVGDRFPATVWHCEKPILRTAPVPLLLLSGEVNRQGFKVVLTGEGADEVFGGYDIFKETLVRKFWSRRPESEVRPLLLGRLHPYIFRDRRMQKTLIPFFRSGIDRPGDPFFSHRIRWETTARTKTFLSRDLRESTAGYDGYEELRGRLPKDFSLWDPLCRSQYLETDLFLGSYLLSSQGDRVAMAHSVEIRLPFLDYRVVEFMARVPSRWKILGLREKRLLKRIFRGLLPEEIVRRTKHPYRAPIVPSLLPREGRAVPESLSGRALKEAGLFDPAKVSRLLAKVRAMDDPRGASEVDGMALAGILSSQILHERFVARRPEAAAPAVPPSVSVIRRTLAT